jgi:membrane protein DedA with SNARE-associated domain
LEHLQVDHALSYLIALVIPALDAIFPVLPGESAVVALGVATAGSTDPRIALLVACAALGAFAGDNLSYEIGRRFGPWAERRFFAAGSPGGQKRRDRRDWAQRSLDRFGMQVIVVCRFIPGGRTAVTLSCGLIGYPRRRFMVATAIAAVIWAVQAFLIGRLGGRAFQDRPLLGLVTAFAGSVALTLFIEAGRRAWDWRQRRRSAGSGKVDRDLSHDKGGH